MKIQRFMVIAGEASGDRLAAELIQALQPALVNALSRPSPFPQPLYASLLPEWFGAGGPAMAASGVELAEDLTRHSVVGLLEVLKHYGQFRRLFHRLLHLAIEREPDAIILVDYAGFNLRFAHAVKQFVRSRQGTFNRWNPKIIYYVSPQVWASRAKRARRMAEDIDLVLSIFPFEKDWYAQHAPALPVEYIGHPLLDRYASFEPPATTATPDEPFILLLPGSRTAEIQRHLPVMMEAARLIKQKRPARFTLVAPEATLAEQARVLLDPSMGITLQVGDLAPALAAAQLAIASTGTVTMECAYFGLPTVALYKTSWFTYQVGKRCITVPYLAMPNILAKETVFPEFIQDDATPENLAREALDLLDNTERRRQVKQKLREIIGSLGSPGAPARGAAAIVRLLGLG